MLITFLMGLWLGQAQVLASECPPVPYCASVRVWLSEGPEGFDDEAFVRAQLAQANQHHQGAGVGFRVLEVLRHPLAEVQTRSERDALGVKRWKRGVIDVYVVNYLANVDEPGEIRGVHWRYRKERKRRWVIVSRISSPNVLAHELGHYFGLPHSEEADSLMNPRAGLEQRRFLPAELERIRSHAKAFWRDKTLGSP